MITDEDKSNDDEIEFSKNERKLIDITKRTALDKARTPHGNKVETYDYDKAWRLFVERSIMSQIDIDRREYLAENEKPDWIEELKQIHRNYLDKNNKGWTR